MKIVLFGDSIRLAGYGKKVEEELKKEGHEVFQPNDNCRFIKHTLRMIFDLREEIKDADIIHFNAGIWDSCALFHDGEYYSNDFEPFSSLEEYEINLRRVVKLFKEITPHVIFATTTPVNPRQTDNNNERIDEFNKVAVKVMKELDASINDLGSLIKEDIDNNICSDFVHLTDKGAELAAVQVLESIHKEIEKI